MVIIDTLPSEIIHNTVNELPELLTAVSYWTNAVIKHDKNVPTWKLKTFYDELFHGLKKRCEGHWYPEDPDRGQGYRSLICAERVDTLLLVALHKAQLVLDFRQICGEEAVMYVDPGNVSIRMFPSYARGRRDTTQTLFPSSPSSSTGGSTSPIPSSSSSSSSSPSHVSPSPASSSSMNFGNNIHRPIVQLA